MPTETEVRSMGKRGFVGLVLALALVGAACGGDDGGNNEELTGNLFISGSSTVEPITALVAELFNETQPGVAINVEGPGTGDGFELFCNGETDISDASRPIDEEEEVPVCQENGIEYIELEVAIDGMAVMTHTDNSAVSCLALTDLYALMGPESEGFANWSDANDLAAELGAPNAPYPDAELTMVAPGEESGTYDSFVELVFEDIASERGIAEDDIGARPDYQSSPNDNVIIEGIAGSPGSLGWVGYAFYVENQDVVKGIEVDDGESGCVPPNEETIASGDYPLQRSLYIYVNSAKAAEKPELQAFVDFYMSDDGMRTAVSEVGYVQLPDDRIEQTRSTWESEAPA
jgi:phosphate transport system substrate-binding protein